MSISEEEKTYIEELIAKRADAKKAKDFTTADLIRKELEAKQIQLMDTANGTQWEKVN